MKIKNIIRRAFFKGHNNSDSYLQYEKKSWSQSGEDIIIEYLFGLRKIVQPSCLDIGAFDPIISNNTYKFFLKNSRILNIDANPSAIERFEKERPSDTNLNLGIGGKEGTFDFYIMEDESLNTFSVVEKSNLEILGHRVKEIKKINVVTVNQLINKYFNSLPPDLISIDAEGVDFDIIRSLDFNTNAPKVICIESINYTPEGTGTKRFELCRFIEEAGYFEYANTNINSIFVNKNWWFGAS